MTFLEDLFAGGAKGVLEPIKDIISLWKLDPNKQADRQLSIIQMESAAAQAEMNFTLAMTAAQNKINEIEAASQDWFVRRARPAAIWVCVIGLTYSVVLFPFLVWFSLNMGWKAPPELDVYVLTTLLFSLLGVATLRTMDKKSGAILGVSKAITPK